MCVSVECSFWLRIGIPIRRRSIQLHAILHSWIMQLRVNWPKRNHSYSLILIYFDIHWWAMRVRFQYFTKFGKDWWWDKTVINFYWIHSIIEAYFHPFFSTAVHLWSWTWCQRWSHRVANLRKILYDYRQYWLFYRRWVIWVRKSPIWCLWCITKKLYCCCFMTSPNCAIPSILFQHRHRLLVPNLKAESIKDGNDLTLTPLDHLTQC